MELSRWRVLHLLLTMHLNAFVPAWLQVLCGIVVLIGAGIGGVTLIVELDGGLVLAVVWGALTCVCLYALVMTQGPNVWWDNPAFALDEHPRLRRVFLEAMELAEVGTVPKVRLWSLPAMTVHTGRRIKFWLGLPLVTELEEDELRAIVVRHLLVSRLSWRDRWVASLNLKDLARAASGKPHPDRARLRAQAKRIRQELWRETAALVGQETLARATRREIMIDHAFAWHVYRYVRLWADHHWGFPSDAFESFRWKVREDGLLARIQPRVDTFVAEKLDRHERELLLELGWDSGAPVAPATDPVADRLPARLERRMAHALWRELFGRPGSPLGVKGGPIRDKPAELWVYYQEAERIGVLAAATALLGRPASAEDVVRLAAGGRAGELEWSHTSASCPHPAPEVCVLMPLLDVALRRLGYLHADPFVQRVLVGRLGDRVDVVELAGEVARGLPYGLELGVELNARDPDEDVRRLAAESLAAGDPIGWFERLYAESDTGDAIVPWDFRRPHVMLVDWASKRGLRGKGLRALVVGAGLGNDAQYIAGLGFETVAFDVSESAVRLAGERFPGESVRYVVADLLDPPGEWREAFDLVVEISTVQALPEALHSEAIARVSSFVGPGGTLVVIASARNEGQPVFAPPWPLTPSEIAAFATGGVVMEESEDFPDAVRHHCRATFHRPA
ncbi:class I SAM-dependent methyltransferase [Nonomuraea cavernae]|nr:class I SAM-dependent methyltransferase [Nonomuraea cavernae]